MKKAIDIDEEDVEVLKGWAVALQGVGRLEEADFYYNQAYERAPDVALERQNYLKFLLTQAKTWTQTGREARAWQTYLKLLQLDPGQSEAIGAFDEYWRSMDPLYEPSGLHVVLNPDSMSRTVKEGWMQYMLQQGIEQSQQEKLALAEEWLLKIKVISPSHPGLKAASEQLYRKQLIQTMKAGEFGEFRRKYRYMVREGILGGGLKKQFLPLLKQNIRLWERQQAYHKVLAGYELWNEWDKSNAVILLAWAKVFAKLGNYEQAEEKLIKAYQMNVNLFEVVSVWGGYVVRSKGI